MQGPIQTPANSPKLPVECVETEPGFERLEAVWNKLLRKSPRPVPFLTWEWISTWWKHFGGDTRLFVLVAHDGDEVVGIAPLCIAVRKAFGLLPVRTVEFLGYRGSAVCADHLDFLTCTNRRHEIIGALLDSLLAHKSEWDAIVLASVAAHSPLRELFPQRCASGGGSTADGPTETCPFLELTSNWALFLKETKRSHQNLAKNIKRLRNRLARTYRMRFVAGSAITNIHSHLETLAHLHLLARQRKGGMGNFRLRDYREFHHAVAERMAQAGHLYLARLDCDEQPTAAWYGFHVGNVLYYYQSGFDTALAQYRMGEVLLGMIVEDAIEHLHATELDFLRGEEEYKFRWTKQVRYNHTLLCWGHNHNAQMAQAEFILRRRVSRWKKQLARTNNVMPPDSASTQEATDPTDLELRTSRVDFP